MVKKGLGFYIVISFLVALLCVIAIGGISIFMVDKIMGRVYSIEKESKNIDFVNHFHNKTYNFILAVHHFIINPDEYHSTLATMLFSEMERDLQWYIEYEKGETSRESKEEIRLLRLLQENFSGIKRVVPVFKEFSPNAAYDVKKLIYMEKYAYNIETLINEINRLHFYIISRKVEKSRKTMSFVFTLYVIFSCFGFVMLYSGYKIHSHFIIEPIKKLAEATQKLSDGDLSVRVKTGSKAEIGVLYNSFNNMAEKLQTNEKSLLDFNYELEQKVKERTGELQGAYNALKKAQTELIGLEKIATLGQIATSVNHEIKTPLNSLYLNLQMLRKKTANRCEGCEAFKDSIGDMVSIIDREVLRINDILDEFVRYARFSPTELKENDLNSIVREVVDMISQRTEDAGVKLTLSLSEGIPMIMLDENKIIQALINLCINAIHAMHEGGTLGIKTAIGNEYVSVVISDTGPGIPVEHLEKIFIPFFTTKDSGLGFGLSIVQRIVEAHGGVIYCTSIPGKGTEFEIRIPKTLEPEKLKNI